MAARFCLYVVFSLLFVEFSISTDPPQISPSLAPEVAAYSPKSAAPVFSPSNPPFSSPPSPPPSDVGMAPGLPESSPVPVPSPNEASAMQHSNVNVDGDGDVDEAEDGSGGLNGGKKAGIAVGVIAAACLVGVGGLVYKKRQDNIRRSQYGNAARREIL